VRSEDNHTDYFLLNMLWEIIGVSLIIAGYVEEGLVLLGLSIYMQLALIFHLAKPLLNIGSAIIILGFLLFALAHGWRWIVSLTILYVLTWVIIGKIKEAEG